MKNPHQDNMYLRKINMMCMITINMNKINMIIVVLRIMNSLINNYKSMKMMMKKINMRKIMGIMIEIITKKYKVINHQNINHIPCKDRLLQKSKEIDN